MEEERQEDIRSLYRELNLSRSFTMERPPVSEGRDSSSSCACCWLEKLADLLETPPKCSAQCSFVTAPDQIPVLPFPSPTVKGSKGPEETCISCTELVAQLCQKRQENTLPHQSCCCLNHMTRCSEPNGQIKRGKESEERGGGEPSPNGVQALRLCSRLLRSLHRISSASGVAEFQYKKPEDLKDTEQKNFKKRKVHSEIRELRSEVKKKQRKRRNNGRSQDRNKSRERKIPIPPRTKKRSLTRISQWLESVSVDQGVTIDPEVLEHVRKIHELLETKTSDSTGLRCCEWCKTECGNLCDQSTLQPNEIAGEVPTGTGAEPADERLAKSDEEPSAEHSTDQLWAVTRVSVFADRSRTYEVLRPRHKPPSTVPSSADAVFLLLPPQIQAPLS